MKNAESLTQYYERLPLANPDQLSADNAGPGHFNVFDRNVSGRKTLFNRRDFYKVSLILNKGKLHYANKSMVIDKPALLFSSPLIPYSWEADSQEQEGWFCIFTPAFIHPFDFKRLIVESPLFKAGGEHVFFAERQQLEFIRAVFKRMAEIQSGRSPNYELCRNYLYALIYEALEMRPAKDYIRTAGA